MKRKVNVTSPFKQSFVEVDELQMEPVTVKELYEHPCGFSFIKQGL